MPEPGNHSIEVVLVGVNDEAPLAPPAVVEFRVLTTEEVLGHPRPWPRALSRAPWDANDKQTCANTDTNARSSCPNGVEFSELTLVLLTWGSPATVRYTLESYDELGLLSAVNETIIFVQQISFVDFAEIGDFPRLRVVGDSQNFGIGRGQLFAISLARTRYVLFLEHDWSLSRDWRPSISEALRLVSSSTAHIARFRDELVSPVAFNCPNPNPRSALAEPQRIVNGLYCCCFRQRLWLDPPNLVLDQTGPGLWTPENQALWEAEGVRRCPGQPERAPAFMCVPGRLCGFSNNPTLYDKEWFMVALGGLLGADAGPALRGTKGWERNDWKFYSEVKAFKLWPLMNVTVASPYRGIFAHTPLKDSD